LPLRLQVEQRRLLNDLPPNGPRDDAEPGRANDAARTRQRTLQWQSIEAAMAALERDDVG